MIGNSPAFGWFAVALTTITTFYGFELAFGATGIGGDILALAGAVLVVIMAQSSRAIFIQFSSSAPTIRLICRLSLFVGSCYAFMGAYSFLSSDTDQGGYLEHHFWKAFFAALFTAKGAVVAFLTTVYIFFSTQPLKLPARPKNKSEEGGGGFNFYRAEEPKPDKPDRD
jgi:hypothetical protein